jgi:cysteine-rich repeat protein
VTGTVGTDLRCVNVDASAADGACTAAGGYIQHNFYGQCTGTNDGVAQCTGDDDGAGSACALNGGGDACAVDGGDCVFAAGAACALNAGGDACAVDGGDCVFVAGPSTTCPDQHCVLHQAEERACTYYEEAVTCLTNPFPMSAAAPIVGDVDVVVEETGLANTADFVEWSYMNLWSAKTTWGGNDPPMSGDSVVVTQREYIVMDISPPVIHLLILQGTLAFQDTQDLMLNASYIFIHGGRLQVGTESKPFMHEAYITIHGNRAAYEIPVYGSKCLGVRNGILDLHGRPDVKWTRLAESADKGQTFIRLRDAVQWRPNDLIVIASTEFNQEQSEPMRVKRVTDGGYTVLLTKPLKHLHLGDGWANGGFDLHGETCTPVESIDAAACAGADLSHQNVDTSREACEAVGAGKCVYHSGRGWSEDGDQISEYSAEVGLLTSNVRVSGDMPVSRIEQFGTQIVLHARGDNSAIGRLSFIEVFNAGQGLKLGKYPIHFHMIGDVSRSYVKGVSVHHVFNRAIAIHGVRNLHVQDNFVFDARGHAIFLEDGTETGHIIEHNAVIVTRPVWSLLMVDQSPAAFWIVNPDNIVRNNAATSSHYGFWYRALPAPDGVSGQEQFRTGPAKSTICPNKTPLNVFQGNVAHSVGKYGLKINQYTPRKGANSCAGAPTASEPAIFKDFTVYKANFFGIWGENWVDLHFKGLRFADYGMAGIEPMSMNGVGAMFPQSNISHCLFVGTTTQFRPRSGSAKGCHPKTGICQRQTMKFLMATDFVEAMDGLIDASQLDNNYVHAMHLPGTGSEILMSDTTIVRHKGIFIGAAWVSKGRGGYETYFERMTLKRNGLIASWTHKYSWILVDRDGSMAGRPGSIVPKSGVFERNPDCHLIHCPARDATESCPGDNMIGAVRGGHGGSLRGAYICDKPVRRVGFSMSKLSFALGDPKLFVSDITDIAHDDPEYQTPNWWPTEHDSTDLKLVSDVVGFRPAGHKHPMNVPYGTVPKGKLSCLEQRPKMQYNFLVSTGRQYLLALYDSFDVFVSAGMKIHMFKMQPDEHVIFTTSFKAPFNRERFTRGYVTTSSDGGWAVQGQENAWGDMGTGFMPTYGTGELQGECAANGGGQYALSSPLLPAPTTPSMSTRGPGCMISRSCKPLAHSRGLPTYAAASGYEPWNELNCRRDRKNLARGKATSQSSTYPGGDAERAVDGNPNGDWTAGFCMCTNNQQPWWQVDLMSPLDPAMAEAGEMPLVAYVYIHNRDSHRGRLSGARITVSDTPDFTDPGTSTHCATVGVAGAREKKRCANGVIQGRYVTISSTGTDHLNFCEVEVFSCAMPASGLPAGHSCRPQGRGPELGSHPEFMPADADGHVLGEASPYRHLKPMDVKLDQFESEFNAGSESVAERALATRLNLAVNQTATMKIPGGGQAVPTMVDGDVSTCPAGVEMQDPFARIELDPDSLTADYSLVQTVYVHPNQNVVYEGTTATTASGYACRTWNADDAEWDHNYCRNPDNKDGGPWCHIDLEKNDNMLVWHPNKYFANTWADSGGIVAAGDAIEGTWDSWDYCGVGGDLSVRLAKPGMTWDEAEPYECKPHRTGYTGPHNTEIDPASGLATFYCNDCPSTGQSPFERPGRPGGPAAGGGYKFANQLWASEGEQPGGQNLRACNHTGHELAGPFTHVLVGVEGNHALDLCDVGAFANDKVSGFAAYHGAFYFDPWDERGGDSMPWYYTPCRPGYANADWSNCGPKRQPQANGKVGTNGYNPAYTAAMSVVVAGNTTVSLGATKCPRAGCPYKEYPRDDFEERTFYWSDAAGWDKTGDPNVDVPSDYSDIEIPKFWTVILDVTTPVMRVLTIRGKLIVQQNPSQEIALHAHWIDVRGGTLNMGNETHPFLGPKLSLILHGDVYVWQGIVDGECNSPIDPLTVAYPICGKKMNVRGSFTAHGRKRDELRRIAIDAEPGDSSVTLESPVDWRPGEKVVMTAIGRKHTNSIVGGGFSGRKHTSQHETRTVDRVEGLTVYFTEPLRHFHQGTIIDEPDAGDWRDRVDARLGPNGANQTAILHENNGRFVMDTRDTAALLDGRNVHIAAGDDPWYDTVSGVPMRAQQYGFTIHMMGPGAEPKPGWTSDMRNYASQGRMYMPPGRVHVENVEFHDAGKQYIWQCGGWTCIKQYPAISAARVGGHSGGKDSMGRPGFGSPVMHNGAQHRGATAPIVRGVVSITPRTGLMVGGVPSVTFENNVMMGHDMTFTSGRMVNNLFIAETPTVDCPWTCTESFPLRVAAGDDVVFKDNRMTDAYVGLIISKPCSAFKEYSNNVMMGNYMGARISGGCKSLPLEVYRNSIGVGVDPSYDYIENVEAAENGVAFMNHAQKLPPEITPSLAWRWFRGRTIWTDSSIIGRSQKSLAKRSSDLDSQCGRSEEHWNGHPLASGGLVSGFKSIGTQWDYVGIHLTGTGTAAEPEDGAKHEVDGVHFIGFPGLDECGRKNVAVTNDHGIFGKGTHQQGRTNIFGVGRVTVPAATANYGFITCIPVFIRNLQWTEVPVGGKWQFSMGTMAGRESAVSHHPEMVPAYSEEVFSRSCEDGFETEHAEAGFIEPGATRERNDRTESTCFGRDGWPKAERHHGGSTDYAASECMLFDEDGSLTPHPVNWPKPGVGPHWSPPDSPAMYVSAAPRQWPALYNGHCQYTLYNSEWWDTRDEINAINRCPPFLRREPSLLTAANVPSRQGVSFQKPDDGTWVADWGRHGKMPTACTPFPEVGGMDCNRRTGNDYIWLRNKPEKKIVSGSNVLYGPAVLSTCSYDGGQPMVNFVPTEYFPHSKDAGGTGPWGGVDQELLTAFVSPHIHHVTNGGCYRLDYTGDVGIFRRNYFSILNTEMVTRLGRKHMPRAPRNQENSWGVVLEMWYTFPGIINVFFNEAFVPPFGRRDRVTFNSPAGSNYFNPGSRIISFVVKATTKTDVVKLRLVDVVMVNLIVAETFESFFDDNDIDPSAIAPSFSNSFPPDYAANYDPDRGGIIKQNRFVRNMASVLRINPERIRVTNIVPGNRRRRMQDAASCTATDVAEQSTCDAALINDPSGAECTNAGCVFVAPRYLQEADDLDIGFDISANDPCKTVNCGQHGECNDSGLCVCETNWLGDFVPEGCTASTGTESDCALSAAQPESCTASTGVATDCTLTPADSSADPPLAGSCATAANDATCTYVAAVSGSCAVADGATAGATCQYVSREIGCGSNPCADVTCGEHVLVGPDVVDGCTSSVGPVCRCEAGWSGDTCEVEPAENDPCLSVVCPEPPACHAAGSCPPHTCSARAQTITCTQPADGADACPDNTDDCVFTPGGSCSYAGATTVDECLEAEGTWAVSTQGSCALTSQAACTASLELEDPSAECEALKCTYAGGVCSAATPLAEGTACDDGNANTVGDVCTAAGACVGTVSTAPPGPPGVDVVQGGNQETFDELASIGNALVESATNGTLDVGYDVTGMDVVLPDDVCGVAGGDGTSCLDLCGVALGDNTTCADVCGVANGDGFSCRDDCDSCTALNPNIGGDVTTCSAVNVSSGTDGAADEANCVGAGGGGKCLYTGGTPHGDGSSCAPPVELNSIEQVVESCGISERQHIQLSGPMGMTGTMALSFNGETTGNLSVPYSTVDDVATALAGLSTVGSVAIVGLLNDGAIMESVAGATRLNMVVEFNTVAASDVRPLNGGLLPLLQVESYPTETTGAPTVARACAGQPPAGQTYEEQTVVLPGAVGGTFRLGFGGEESEPIAWDAAPGAVAAALTYISSLDEDVDNDGISDLFEVFDNATSSWSIRFYPREFSPVLLLSEVDASTVTSNYTGDLLAGNLPLLSLNTTSLTQSDGASAPSVEPATDGSVPQAWVPPTCTDQKMNGDELGTDCGGSCFECPSPPPPPERVAGSSTIVVAAVTRVCGDGRRTSDEACDDGNTAGGDGCSADCTIESGFLCLISIIDVPEPGNRVPHEDGLLGLSECAQPDGALVSFAVESQAVTVEEGTVANLTVLRTGDLLMAGVVHYETVVTNPVSADPSARNGSIPDFTLVTAGDVSFGVGQTEAILAVPALLDGIFDEPTETFAVRLWLAADDQNQLLAGDVYNTEPFTSMITITNAEQCAGWPPVLAARVLTPCTAEQSRNPENAEMCAAKGTCPHADDESGPHGASCEFVCEPGYNATGGQPRCDAATGQLTESIVCEAVPGVVSASVTVAIDITLLSGEVARQEFEESFSTQVAALLGIDASRVSVVDIVAASDRRLRRLQAGGASVVVTFRVLPDAGGSSVTASDMAGLEAALVAISHLGIEYGATGLTYSAPAPDPASGGAGSGPGAAPGAGGADDEEESSSTGLVVVMALVAVVSLVGIVYTNWLHKKHVKELASGAGKAAPGDVVSKYTTDEVDEESATIPKTPGAPAGQLAPIGAGQVGKLPPLPGQQTTGHPSMKNVAMVPLSTSAFAGNLGGLDDHHAALEQQLDQLKRWFESGLITEAVWHERQRSLLHGGEGGPGGPSTGSDPAHKAAGVAEARGMLGP